MSSLPQAQPLPPLESGDHLTRAEFERRYHASPHLKKAELVEGVVYVPSPVKQNHAKPDGMYITWLTLYATRTPGVEALPNATVRLDGDNEPQPDSMLYIPGRAATVDDEGYVSGSPEFIVEIASSSASYDLHTKKRAYQRNGVSTYVVHLVQERSVCWFELEAGTYALRTAVDGLFQSRVFPGLWLNEGAALAGDVRAVLATLDEGLKTAEHAAFVASLAS
ncbi:MAG: Uma2 family endonuclease [Myxococcales bacterium]|nr:Uma2 family endonuclease [Myxococcales bacterium]